MKKEDLISEVLGHMKEITVCKDGYKNSFDFGKDDVYWFWDGFDPDVKFRVFCKLKKDEVFKMSLGDGYFYINGSPCSCRITQINNPEVGERDNYEMIVIIEVNRLYMDEGSVINDFHKFFKKYDGEIFDEIELIEDRFDILDL
jgi:hypothetical protein